MSKMLATCAAIAVTALFALPAPASAAERSAPGVKQADEIEVSSARRHRRYVRHYYGPRYRSYYAPYDAYAYDPYYSRPYYRPYYRPGVSVGVGPFGFGFGF